MRSHDCQFLHFIFYGGDKHPEQPDKRKTLHLVRASMLPSKKQRATVSFLHREITLLRAAVFKPPHLGALRCAGCLLRAGDKLKGSRRSLWFFDALAHHSIWLKVRMKYCSQLDSSLVRLPSSLKTV